MTTKPEELESLFKTELGNAHTHLYFMTKANPMASPKLGTEKGHPALPDTSRGEIGPRNSVSGCDESWLRLFSLVAPVEVT